MCHADLTGDFWGLRRRLDPLDGSGEHISDPALSLDDAGCAGVVFELAAEAQNLNVDAAVEDIVVHAGRLQQMIATQWPLRRRKEGQQHGILSVRQCDVSAARIGEPADPEVELPAQKPEAATFGITRQRDASGIGTSQYRTGTREQLAQIKRLRQIIVSTKLQPNHPVNVAAAVAGNDDDWQLRAKPDLSQEIEAVLQAQPKIENHEIDPGTPKLIGHLLTIAREQNADAVLVKKIMDHTLQGGIVLNEKNARLALFVFANPGAFNRRVAHFPITCSMTLR
jgi:hypothetical protein